jgi:CRISPR-associated protein Cas2
MLVLVSYDVSTINKAGRRRLVRIAKTCLDYGQRVQNSVFECLVDPAQWTALRAELLKRYKPEEDSLRFYFLGKNWESKVEHYGTKETLNLEDDLLLI